MSVRRTARRFPDRPLARIPTRFPARIPVRVRAPGIRRSFLAIGGGAVLATSLVVASCSSSAPPSPSGTSSAGSVPGTTKGSTPGSVVGENPALSAFYLTPSPLPDGKPGDVIRSEPLSAAPSGS